jgi:hypothetical protein
MGKLSRMNKVIEVYDFDGTVANTVEMAINKRLPAAIRNNELLRKGMANISFVLGELIGAGKEEAAGMVAKGKIELNEQMLGMLRRHQEAGAEIVVLTSNGHSDLIKKIMADNGVNAAAVHCESKRKADFIKELARGNPDKQIVSVNDSIRETFDAFSKGLRYSSVLFRGPHNSLPSCIIGFLRIAEVANAESIDSAIKMVARD